MPLIVHPSSPPPTLTPQEEQRRNVRGYILFAFAMAVLFGVLWKLRNVLEVVYVSALFAVVLMPIVQQIRRVRIFGRQPSRTVAVIGLVIAVFLGLALFFIIAMPPVISRYFKNNIIDLFLLYCCEPPSARTACLAKNKRNTSPKMNSSTNSATATEKTIPAMTAITVITNCITSSREFEC